MKQSSTGLISGQPASRRHDKSEAAQSRREPLLWEGTGAIGGQTAVSFTCSVVNSGSRTRLVYACNRYPSLLFEQTLLYSSLALLLGSGAVIFSVG